jgi:hypothetical protein
LKATDDEMSYLEWKAWWKKHKFRNNKKKSNTKVVIESSDDSNTEYKRRPSRSSNKGSSSKEKKGKLSIVGSLMTIPFKFLVITMLQFIWESPRILMGWATINGRQRGLVT